jgi:hypothetical protein
MIANQATGITGKSYLTRTLLNKIFKKELSNDEIDDLIVSGQIIKKFSYFQPSEMLLRKIGVIPNKVSIQQEHFGFIAKKNAFTMQQLMDIFDCNKDTIKILIDKLFQRRNNYYYKNDRLNDALLEGETEFKV